MNDKPIKVEGNLRDRYGCKEFSFTNIKKLNTVTLNSNIKSFKTTITIDSENEIDAVINFLNRLKSNKTNERRSS